MSRDNFNIKSIAAISCLLLGLAGAGFAQENTNPAPQNSPTQNEPPANAPKENVPPGQTAPNAPKIATAPLPTSGGAPVDSKSYKVGAADVLLIRVWNEPAFTGPVAVQENGSITLQLVGDLPVAGKTPYEIQEMLTKALTKFVVKPLVTVTVSEVGSKRYYMDGMVNRAGEYNLVVPTTILEAISKAGGLQDFANQKHIYILRGDKRIYFNYHDVLRGKHMEENVLLQPGDHVVIP